VRVTLREGAKVYEIGRHMELRDRGPARTFPDEFSARAALLRFSRDPSNMAALRAIFRDEYQGSALARLTDRQVVEAVSRLLVAGTLRLILRPEEPRPRFVGGALGRNMREAAPAPPRRVRAEAPASNPAPETPPPEGSELPADVDSAAVAAIMRQAARDGVPFCEE
jgi:hypothetical protein